MIRTLDLKYINGKMYGVSKLPGNISEWVVGVDNVLYPPDSTNMLKIRCFNVEVTNDSSLGLPLIPEVEDDVKSIASKWAITEGLVGEDNLGTNSALNKGFIAGYKKARKKEFTEDDMFKSFIAGRKFQQGGASASPSRGGQPERNEPDFPEFIHTIKRKPIQVKVEMEQLYEDQLEGREFVLRPAGARLLIERGFVKVYSWVYEDN